MILEIEDEIHKVDILQKVKMELLVTFWELLAKYQGKLRRKKESVENLNLTMQVIDDDA